MCCRVWRNRQPRDAGSQRQRLPHPAARRAVQSLQQLAGDRHRLDAIFKGEARWPQDRDVLYFLAQAFRARLLKTLPDEKAKASGEIQSFVHGSKAMLKDLCPNQPGDGANRGG